MEKERSSLERIKREAEQLREEMLKKAQARRDQLIYRGGQAVDKTKQFGSNVGSIKKLPPLQPFSSSIERIFPVQRAPFVSRLSADRMRSPEAEKKHREYEKRRTAEAGLTSEELAQKRDSEFTSAEELYHQGITTGDVLLVSNACDSLLDISMYDLIQSFQDSTNPETQSRAAESQAKLQQILGGRG